MAFLCARLGGRRPSRLSLTHGLADSPALLDGHGYGVVWNVAFSPSAERLASVSQDGELLIWTTDPPALLQHIDVESTFLYALCWAHDSSAIAVGGGSAHIFVYAYAADTAVRSTTVRCSSIVQGLAFSHDSTLLAAASSEGSAWLYAKGASLAEWQLVFRVSLGSSARGLGFHPREPLLAVGVATGEILLLDLGAGTVAARLSGGHEAGDVRRVRFTQSGLLCSASRAQSAVVCLCACVPLLV
eukprot:TRINITY_DN382_c0_g1_i3.p2 TRINITY_DN382_c0_g1~~TRINITY_DN382_c0_g1_i3.p2  ORF type:complete len:265 (-),score=52.20 TRINITY_DN382_c0_g1_i3:465-1196(-)